jgi:hypothetical protein
LDIWAFKSGHPQADFRARDIKGTSVLGLVKPTENIRPPPSEPRSAAVSFVTTEHFTLQGARSSTIAESVGRATMFLSAVSGGLITLGLVATAVHIGTEFYAFALILLPTLTFVGLATLERVVQSGIEDHGYAVRIARLRAYYFAQAPEVTPYLASVSPERRLVIEGLLVGCTKLLRNVAGMVGVVTGVLAGSTAGLAACAAASSLTVPLASGLVVGLVVVAASIRYQAMQWYRAMQAPMFEEQRR